MSYFFYADYHNAVFVGLDENGVPRQAHKRSTITHGASFRMTCEGSDTWYSFAHFGTSGRLFVFEAPIDMLSFLTLFPQDWQQHSYIAMNSVYENAMLRALETHPNLQEIILCTDHDEGGIDAAYRLADILAERGYSYVKRFSPALKDWNYQLKYQHGADYLPACAAPQAGDLSCAGRRIAGGDVCAGAVAKKPALCVSGKELSISYRVCTCSSAYFLQLAGYAVGFEKLRQRLKSGYRSYSDRASSQSLQMIGRPLMMVDELKSMQKGQFVVMKTETHPMISPLRLYFKWGIQFHESYQLPDKGARRVSYLERDSLFQAVSEKYSSEKKYGLSSGNGNRKADGGFSGGSAYQRRKDGSMMK